MKRMIIAGVAVLASCAAPPAPVPLTPAADIPGAAVVRRPIEPAPAIPPASVARAKPAAPQAAAPVVPADRQYVCVTHANGEQQQTTIEFAPKVAELCRKHPEMGPCQYERDLCRRSGGRVYADGGREITAATEAEYDKKVMRVRFRAN